MTINKRAVIKKQETKNVGNRKKGVAQQTVARNLVTVL